jgi:acetyl-CoA C-acetyltransferase
MKDMDFVELNEAFAAQTIPCRNVLEIPDEKLNVWGGAIALGHPVGATGAILTVKMLHILKQLGGRYGLVTMCVGGGQGGALILEIA